MGKTEDDDQVVLHFEHPAVVGTTSTGWMEVRKGRCQTDISDYNSSTPANESVGV